MKGGMNVAWAMLWGGSRSTKPCVFSCKVAAGDEERYILCAAGAAAIVLVPPLCFATRGCSCVRSSMRFLNPWLQIALEWLHDCCMGYVVGRKPEHETLCFSCKVAAGDDERYILCAAGAAAIVLVSPLCFATRGCSCVRSSMRLLNLWLQIAVEWLRQSCLVPRLHV